MRNCSFLLLPAMLLLANQSLNETETGQDDEEREMKMREVQAIMREMRLRNLTGQKYLADREKMEADKCKFYFCLL